MKKITILKNFINTYEKKEIFLFSFYITFILLLFLSVYLDYQIENYTDLKIELTFALFALIGFIYLYISKNIDISINIIVILATLMTYVLSSSNGFGISVFQIIIPLSFFLLFTLKRALIYFFIHNSIIYSLYIYGVHIEQIQYTVSKLVGIFIAILFILAFGIFYHIAIENSFKKLELINNELKHANYQKEILLNEIHHRIKNSLYFVSSMLGLQQKAEKDPKLTKILEKNRLRIQSIAMIHEVLYKYDSFEEISFDIYTKKLCDTILELYNNKTVVTIQKSNIYLSTEDTLRFGIITNELLTNSLKHAFNKKSGEVTISLTKTIGSYIYKYHDNSKIEIDKKKFMKDDTLGLKIIYMMVDQMEGKLNISFDSGFRFEIKTLHS